MSLKIAGLFAGIGGIEEGFRRALGPHEVTTALLCEWWEPARKVLSVRFPDAPLHSDIRDLERLPRGLDVLTAGFPCTDLSQAGRTAGIHGQQSGLVRRIFDLLEQNRSSRRGLPAWIVIENVANMLPLAGGAAMRFLTREIECFGYRWAYRVVDSRFTGLPQRRRRVLLVAGRRDDPRSVLFADNVGERPENAYRDDAFGFYWTEGRGGLGWARDAVPTLKGGSTVGIPSPPGIWVAANRLGRRLVCPSIEDAEEMQGFPRGWTVPAQESAKRNGPRWKLVGNAVTVDVSQWLAGRLTEPGEIVCDIDGSLRGNTWPTAAWGERGVTPRRVLASEFPVQRPYRHLSDVVDLDGANVLSHRAARGFLGRLRDGNLGRHPGFREDVARHVEALDPELKVATMS